VYARKRKEEKEGRKWKEKHRENVIVEEKFLFGTQTIDGDERL
jgi:hypothetical protein